MLLMTLYFSSLLCSAYVIPFTLCILWKHILYLLNSLEVTSFKGWVEPLAIVKETAYCRAFHVKLSY